MFLIQDYFDEGGNIFDFYQKDHPMSGQEIAAELNTSRQHISQQLKRILAKLVVRFSFENKELSPFEVVVYMIEVLGINQRDESEVKKFFKLLPLEAQKKIANDGRKWLETYERRTK